MILLSTSSSLPFRRIAWGLCGALVVLVGWWALAPRIQTADEAVVRWRIAPELLAPLPHPEGGRERAEALRGALQGLWAKAGNRSRTWRYDLADPQVGAVIAILREGELDRAGVDVGWSVLWSSLAQGLATMAREQARTGDWTHAGQQMEAAFLLLDRLVGSNASMFDQAWIIRIESDLYVAVLDLASLDPPEVTARLLAAQLEPDRHSPESFLRYLGGAMQFDVLPWLADLDPAPTAVFAGNYDPFETAGLISDSFMEAARNVGLPASQRSTVVAGRIATVALMSPGYSRCSTDPPDAPRWSCDLGDALGRSWHRIRMNTTRNSIGRELASWLDSWHRLDPILQVRSLQDQAAAAVAVSRFRQSARRNPADFGELIAAGLLLAVPLDRSTQQPLHFDLRALFEPPRQMPGTGR